MGYNTIGATDWLNEGPTRATNTGEAPTLNRQDATPPIKLIHDRNLVSQQ